jgi:hypothetical protein
MDPATLGTGSQLDISQNRILVPDLELRSRTGQGVWGFDGSQTIYRIHRRKRVGTLLGDYPKRSLI